MATRLRPKSTDLTRAELEIMLIVWQKGECVVHDIKERLPEPKPAYNTVSTIVRILEKKGFVSHRAFGKTHIYYPVISKPAYTRKYVGSVIQNFFDGSISELVSFFQKHGDISDEELHKLSEMLAKQKVFE